MKVEKTGCLYYFPPLADALTVDQALDEKAKLGQNQGGPEPEGELSLLDDKQFLSQKESFGMIVHKENGGDCED